MTYCKAKRENNGICPNHNLQCGWPRCDQPDEQTINDAMIQMIQALYHAEHNLPPTHSRKMFEAIIAGRHAIELLNKKQLGQTDSE